MKVITHTDIVSLNLSPLLCYEWAEYMIANKASALLPAKISMKPQEGVFCNVMPGIVTLPDGSRYGGVKAVTRYPDRVPSLDSKLLLYDAENGEFKAIMDANWITAMRTGAVAAHSVELFAKRDFRTVGIMGLGNAARASMLVLAERFRDREITVKLLAYKGQETLFAERFRKFENLTFRVVATAEELIRGSDVVISAATYLAGDVCSDEAFGEGVLLVPVHTLGFTNCDLFFDKVYADDYSHVCHFKNFGKFRSFAEVCDVVNGKKAGRENDRERIIAYNIGVSMHDLYYAANIYLMSKDKPHAEIAFNEPTEKFWI